MWKETIICMVIVIAIVLGNSLTQDYTKKSINELNGGLEKLKENIMQEEVDQGKVKKEIDEIDQIWDNRHDKLAYFIEHDELEKVETEWRALKSLIETEEYKEAMSELDKSVFILKHIEDKYAFNLQNIF